MKYIQGKDRKQIPLFVGCLDEAIAPDHEIRLIDLFVDGLQLKNFGFRLDHIDNGRPAYHPGDLLKLFLYGYLNRIRSSRTLEKECHRNLEIMWLLKSLAPDHNTIANFRKDNPEPIRKVFRATVEIARHFELIGGKLVAGDSTKMRAQNSEKNNFSHKKLAEKLEYIEARLKEYTAALAKEDGDTTELQTKIAEQENRKAQYEQIQRYLEQSGEVQYSGADPDSRQLITRNNITEVGYNIQTTVDAKHCLTLDYLVTNTNDSKAMGEMVERTVEVLGHKEFTALYDKGYHTGSEFAKVVELEVEVLVAIPEVSSHAPDTVFDVANFKYNAQGDFYYCPINQRLQTNGRWYNKAHGKTTVKVKHYKTSACQICLMKERCTRNPEGRLIERSEYSPNIEANAKRIKANEATYKRRQAIIEHTYGIIKRQWDFYYITTKKTIQHASADVGLIFTVFNLKRIFNIIDQNQLKTWLGAFCPRLTQLIVSFEAFSALLTTPMPNNSNLHHIQIVLCYKSQNQLY